MSLDLTRTEPVQYLQYLLFWVSSIICDNIIFLMLDRSPLYFNSMLLIVIVYYISLRMNSILLWYFLLKKAKYYILLYRQILYYALGQKLENSVN